MRLKKYTEQQLREAVKNSLSLRQVLSKLGIVEAGGNYSTLKRAISYFEINTSHFTGCGHLKGKTHNHTTRPLSEILVEGRIENTYRLKNRLLKEGVKKSFCENCLLDEWMSKEIPLELHHIDGDTKNNKLENLTLLCPNCHAGTDNYRGKNKKCRDLTETT